MAEYEIPMICTISTTVKVEADSKEAAIEAAYKEGVGCVMFLNHQYPDMGDWEVDENYENENEN